MKLYVGIQSEGGPLAGSHLVMVALGVRLGMWGLQRRPRLLTYNLIKGELRLASLTKLVLSHSRELRMLAHTCRARRPRHSERGKTASEPSQPSLQPSDAKRARGFKC